MQLKKPQKTYIKKVSPFNQKLSHNNSFQKSSYVKRTPEEKLATDLAKPIATYAVSKIINFFFK